MLITKFLYWFFKNLLALTLPLVIILWSFSLNISNTANHNQVLQDYDFYNKFSSEIRNISESNNFNTKESLWFLIISSTQNDISTPTSLQNLFEKNIDSTAKWLSGQDSSWNFYLPASQIHNSLDKNLDIKTVQVAQAKKEAIPTCPDQTQLKYIIDLEKDFCIPESITKGNGLMTDFIRSNLPFQSKIIQVLFGRDPNQLKQTNFKASEIGVANESLMISLNGFRDNFLKTRNIVNTLLPILLISLILIPFFAFALNKRPINEFKIISRMLGVTILVNTLVLMLTSQVIFLQNLNITGLNSDIIVKLMSDIFWQFLVKLMLPSLWLSFSFIFLSYILYLIERLDLDKLRHFLAKSWEFFANKTGLNHVLKK